MLQKIVLQKSKTVSRYPGFSERFWFSYLSSLHNGQDCFNIQKCDPMLITKILLLTKVTLKSFQKKRKILHYAIPSFSHTFFALVMIYYTLPCFSWQNLHQRQEFSTLQLIPHVLGQKVKFTIHLSLFTVTIHYHYSSVTVHDTVHSKFLPI